MLIVETSFVSLEADSFPITHTLVSMTARLIVVAAILLTASAFVLPAQKQQPEDEVEQLRNLSKTNLLIAPVKLDDRAPLSFVLDSGASFVILNDRLVRQYRLALGKRQVQAGAGSNSCEVHVVPNMGISVADVPLHGPAYVAPLGHLEEFTKVQINGIVGGELFLHRAIQVDFSRHTASVLPAKTRAKGKTYTVRP